MKRMRNIFRSLSTSSRPQPERVEDKCRYHRYYYGSLSSNGGALILDSDHIRGLDRDATEASSTPSPIHHVRFVSPSNLFFNVKSGQRPGQGGGFEAAYADVAASAKNGLGGLARSNVTPRRLHSRFGVLVPIMYKQLTSGSHNEDVLRKARILGNENNFSMHNEWI